MADLLNALMDYTVFHVFMWVIVVWFIIKIWMTLAGVAIIAAAAKRIDAAAAELEGHDETTPGLAKWDRRNNLQ